MVEFILTPSQSDQLLYAVEKVRARRVKKAPTSWIQGPGIGWSLVNYMDATDQRKDMIVDQQRYRFTLSRDGGIEVRLVCVHDCGDCVSYVYKAIFEETSLLAREVLGRVSSDPHDVDHPYLKPYKDKLFLGLTA